MAISMLSGAHVLGEFGFRRQGFKTVAPDSSTGEINLDLSSNENNYQEQVQIILLGLIFLQVKANLEQYI